MTAETLATGLTYEVLEEGQIHVFKLSNMSRDTVDVWVKQCLEAMRQCHEAGQPIRVLQDLRSPNAGHTPYSEDKGKLISAAYPDLRGRVAFVLPPSVMAQLIRIYVRSTQQESPTRERRAFENYEAALAWLREGPK